jgi:hypothetical protein
MLVLTGCPYVVATSADMPRDVWKLCKYVCNTRVIGPAHNLLNDRPELARLIGTVSRSKLTQYSLHSWPTYITNYQSNLPGGQPALLRISACSPKGICSGGVGKCHHQAKPYNKRQYYSASAIVTSLEGDNTAARHWPRPFGSAPEQNCDGALAKGGASLAFPAHGLKWESVLAGYVGGVSASVTRKRAGYGEAAAVRAWAGSQCANELLPQSKIRTPRSQAGRRPV